MNFALPSPDAIVTHRFLAPLPSCGLLAIGVAFFIGCSAGEAPDDSDTPTVSAFASPASGGSSSSSPSQVGSAGTGAAGVAPNVAAPSGAGGNGASEVPGGNANMLASPTVNSGGSGGASGAAPSQGQAGTSGGSAGAGAMPNPPPAMMPSRVGRVGAELCPAGPFGAPLPASPTVTKLFSVGENNFFNFEGAVWVNGALYFSEVSGGPNPPPSRINRFVPGGMFERGVIENTGSNGLAVDAQGNLIAATHDVGAISVFALPGGARTQLGAQTFNGTRFNSPNDVVQRLDGNVYFTDPSFQAPGNPQGQTRVYRIPPQGAATVVDDTLSNPNGITLSPDGNTLYVTSASGFRRYDVAADGSTSPGTTISLSDGLQTPDGMAVDCAGNVYTIEHQRRLIRVFSPEGTELGRFGGPQSFDRDITNMAFGGANRTTLFVTSLTQGTEGGVFSVELNIPGLPY
jgi:gluconolactonase